MIEINLLPEDLRRKEGVRLSLPEWPKLKAYALTAGALIALQALVTVFAFYQKLEILAVRTQIASIKKENPELVARKEETAVIGARLKQIDFLTTRRFRWSVMLSRLAHSMTKGVWLREFSVQAPAEARAEETAPASPPGAQRLKLSGSAVGAGQETANIGKFVKSLEENERFAEFFEEIEVSNINQRKVKDFDVYDFELACAFKRQGG
jgi:Tfp pilus assembly protein PilN